MENGCCLNTLFYVDEPVFSSLWSHIKFGLVRFGFMGRINPKYLMTDNLTIQASPEFWYYGNLLDTSLAHTIIESSSVAFGLNVNLIYMFR